MKKIAFISDSVYPFNKGGKEKRIYDITTRLAGDRFDVTIYCMKWWKEDVKTIVQDGVTLYAISPYYPLYVGNRRSIAEAVFFALHCFKMFNKDFDVIEVDHIPHLVLFTMKIVCVLKRKRMIVTWHEVWGKEYWKEYLGGLKGLLAWWIEKISVKLPDTIVSVSDHTTNALRTILGSKKEIITIYNGLNVEEISIHAPAETKTDIIFAGRLLAHKNIDVLLQAVALLTQKSPHLSVCIIGEGPEKIYLKSLAAELHIEKNVSFYDFFEDHAEVYSMMQASRLFVLPSAREGFGIVVIEANACGLPVITVDMKHNAAKELVVDNENGAVCSLDIHVLADMIEKVLRERKDAGFYITYAEKYSWDSIFPRVECLHAR